MVVEGNLNYSVLVIQIARHVLMAEDQQDWVMRSNAWPLSWVGEKEDVLFNTVAMSRY